MRVWLVGAFVAAITAVGMGARGAPRLAIRGATAHVVIIPEARSNIQVTMLKSRRDLPIRISRTGDLTIIAGDVAHRVRGCAMLARGPGVRLHGIGDVEEADLPQIVVRTPLDVRVIAADAVSGAVGRAASVDFENRGCGSWTLANVRGRLRFSQVGSGDVRAGQTGAADLSVAGGGSIAVRQVEGPLTAISSGEGAIIAGAIEGPLIARVAGSGDVVVRTGRAAQVNISVAGSGAVRFGGQAGAVSAEVTGSGHVSIAHAGGPVSRRVFGAGEIAVGR
jgi:hypothetical protein